MPSEKKELKSKDVDVPIKFLCVKVPAETEDKLKAGEWKLLIIDDEGKALWILEEYQGLTPVNNIKDECQDKN